MPPTSRHRGLPTLVLPLALAALTLAAPAAEPLLPQGHAGSAARPAILAAPASSDWFPFGPSDGLAGTPQYEVTCMVPYSGGLVVAGSFRAIGSRPASAIARWDGAAWSDLGQGLNVNAYALATDGVSLYAGGNFTTAGGLPAERVARWDGSAWSALGAGLPNTVRSLLVHGGSLYAGFQGGLRRWDGTAWTDMGISGGTPIVYALASMGGRLYAGGRFTQAGGTPVANLACWDGATWSAMGTGATGDVVDLEPWGGHLYAACVAGTIGGTGSFLGRWDGGAWSGTGVATSGKCLLPTAAGLVLGGRNGAWRYDGSAWSGLGSFAPPTGQSFDSSALAEFGGSLHAGTITVSGFGPGSLLRWDGAAWSAVSPVDGLHDGAIQGVAFDGSTLYVTGTFSRIAGIRTRGIAAWDGRRWSALGAGLGSNGTNVAAGGGRVYVMTPGGIRMWNGSSWQDLGIYNVNGMAATPSGDLLVAGPFTTAAGVAAQGVARWNGSAWSALGAGVTGTPRSVAVAGGLVYVGGELTAAGGVPVTNLAVWDGTAWAALPAGGPVTSRAVTALAASAGVLFAYDGFYVLRWDGTAWASASQNTSQMALAGGLLYIASVSGVYTWDGTTRTTLATSTNDLANGYCYSIAASDRLLAIGGTFPLAFGRPTGGLAVVDLDGGGGAPAAPVDDDPVDNVMPPGAAAGATAGIRVSTLDPDLTPCTWSLTDDAGGRFALDRFTGAITAATIASGPASYAITVAASDRTATASTAFSIIVDNRPGTPFDADPAGSLLRPGAAPGSSTGVTARSTDADGTAPTYVLDDSAGGRFAIDAATGRITVAAAATRGAYAVVVHASDGLLPSPAATFAITVNTAPGAIADANAAGDVVATTAAAGSQVGLTARSVDADGDALAYTLTDSAGGRFAIGAASGVVTTARALTAGSYAITVRAGDGTESATAAFTVLVDTPPAAVADADAADNAVRTDAAAGSPAGITARSTDAEGDAIAYVLDSSAGGRFAIDAATGVVTTAGSPARGSYAIAIRAVDAHGISSPAATLPVVVDIPPGPFADADAAANALPDGAAPGATAGVTVRAADADGDAVSYALTDSAGGRFAIGAASGVVTAAAVLGTGVYTITAQASDGLASSSASFVIIVGNPPTMAAGGDGGGGAGGGGCGLGLAALAPLLGCALVGRRRRQRT